MTAAEIIATGFALGIAFGLPIIVVGVVAIKIIKSL
jgi:Sec-independent protein secretion pathway component TatC